MRTRLSLVFLLVIVILAVSIPASAQQTRRVDQGVTFLQTNKIPPEAFVELSATIGDPQKAAEVLIKYGYTPEEAQAFMTPQNVFTLSGILNPGPAKEVIGQALAILGPYNLSISDLTALMPNLTNPQAMVATLMQKGLTQQQASDLLTQAAPLIQQAGESGVLQYAVINDQVGAMLTQAGFDTNLMYRLGNVINDPEAIAASMKQQGYTDAQIQTFQGMATQMAAQGITPELLEGWTVKNMIYRLEGVGLDPTSINEIVALGNIDAVKDYLIEQGFSGDTLELALTNIQGCLGENGEVLNSERLETFQAAESANLLSAAGIDPEDLGDILAMQDDPEELSAYLAEYGLTDEQIAAFENGLDNSTFAKTVDPEDADAFIESVEEQASMYEDDAGGEEISDDDSGEEISDNDSGEEISDNDSGEEISDDDSGEEIDDTGGDAGGDDSGGDTGGEGDGEDD